MKRIVSWAARAIGERLVINFGERLVKDGIRRVVNGLEDETHFNAKTLGRKDAA